MPGEIFVQEYTSEKLAAELNAASEKLKNNAFFTASAEWGDGELADWVAAKSDSPELLLSVMDFLTELSRRALAPEALLQELTGQLQLFLDTLSLCDSSAGPLTATALRDLGRRVSALLGYLPETKGLSASVQALNEATHFDYADLPAMKCFTAFTELLDQIAAVLEINAIEIRNAAKADRDREADVLLASLKEYNEACEALLEEVKAEEVYKGRSVHSLVIALPKMADMINELEQVTIPSRSRALDDLSASSLVTGSDLSAAESEYLRLKDELDSGESELIQKLQALNEVRNRRDEKKTAAELMAGTVEDLRAKAAAGLAENGDRKAAAFERIPDEYRRPYAVCEKAAGRLLEAPKMTDAGDMRALYRELYSELNPKPEVRKGLFGKEKDIPGYISAEKAIQRLEKSNPDLSLREKYRQAFNDLRREVSLRMQALSTRDISRSIAAYEEEVKKAGEAEAYIANRQAECDSLDRALYALETECARREEEINALSADTELKRARAAEASEKRDRLTSELQRKEAEEKELTEVLARAREHLSFLKSNSKKVGLLKLRCQELSKKRDSLESGIRSLKSRPELTNFTTDRLERLNSRADGYLVRLADRKGNHEDSAEYCQFCFALKSLRGANAADKNDALIELAQAAIAYLDSQGSQPVPKLLQSRLRHVRLNLANEVLNWAIESSRDLLAVPVDVSPSEAELFLRSFEPAESLPDLNAPKKQ